MFFNNTVTPMFNNIHTLVLGSFSTSSRSTVGDGEQCFDQRWVENEPSGLILYILDGRRALWDRIICDQEDHM